MAEKSNAEVDVAAAAEEEQAQPDAKVIPNPPALPMLLELIVFAYGNPIKIIWNFNTAQPGAPGPS